MKNKILKELYDYGNLEVIKKIILEFNIGRYEKKQEILGSILTKEDRDVIMEIYDCHVNEIDTKETFERVIDKYENNILNTIKRIVQINYMLDKEEDNDEEQKPIVVRYAEYFTKIDIIIKAFNLGLELDLISNLTNFSEYKILSILMKNNIDTLNS